MKRCCLTDPLRFVDVQQSQDFELGETAKVVCKVAGYPKGKLYWKKGNLNIDHDPTSKHRTELTETY